MKRTDRTTRHIVAAAAMLFTAQHCLAEGEASSSEAELAKKLSNPVANLISVPIKLDWDDGIGQAGASRAAYLVQPVVPISLNEQWNVISRTIVPVYVNAQSPVPGGESQHGLGDVNQSFFFSPKNPTESGWIWGAGPAVLLPTGSDSLGSHKLGLGPTAVVLKQTAGWTFGMLANQIWSVAGEGSAPNVSALFIQPFLSYTTKGSTTFGLNTESTYNWKTSQWTVPVNLTVAQLIVFRDQPISFTAGLRSYVEKPDGGPTWGLRFVTTFLFPK